MVYEVFFYDHSAASVQQSPSDALTVECESLFIDSTGEIVRFISRPDGATEPIVRAIVPLNRILYIAEKKA